MDMSRVSACTYPLQDRPAEEAMAVIAGAGYKRIDLLGRLPHFSIKADECDPAALKAAAEGNGLEIANLGTYVGVGFASSERAVQEQTLQEVRHTIDLAVFFGARSIRVFRPRSEIDDPARIEHIVPWLQRSAAYAAEKNIYMGFENHGGPLSGHPEWCKELCDKVGSPFFGVLYDPCNLLADGTDYRAALETMKDHIAHVHFKDGAITAQGFKRTMLGQGEIDFVWLVERLNALGYQGHFALEYELPEPPAAEGLKAWYETFAAL